MGAGGKRKGAGAKEKPASLKKIQIKVGVEQYKIDNAGGVKAIQKEWYDSTEKYK